MWVHVSFWFIVSQIKGGERNIKCTLKLTPISNVLQQRERPIEGVRMSPNFLLLLIFTLLHPTISSTASTWSSSLLLLLPALPSISPLSCLKCDPANWKIWKSWETFYLALTLGHFCSCIWIYPGVFWTFFHQYLWYIHKVLTRFPIFVKVRLQTLRSAKQRSWNMTCAAAVK